MNQEVTLFGETTFRNQGYKFGIKLDDRRRHMYIIGKSGMGKSTILENMIVQDISRAADWRWLIRMVTWLRKF